MLRIFATTWKRLAIAIGLVLIGMSLVPYIALPSEQFGWQRFAGIYGGDPEIAVNFSNGAPGSSFTITGANFPANTAVTVDVNGTPLGTLTTDEVGAFMLRITTTTDTDWGVYVVTVTEAPAQVAQAGGASAQTRFTLARSAPLRAPDNTTRTFALPDGIAQNWIYMPMIYGQ